VISGYIDATVNLDYSLLRLYSDSLMMIVLNSLANSEGFIIIAYNLQTVVLDELQ